MKSNSLAWIFKIISILCIFFTMPQEVSAAEATVFHKQPHSISRQNYQIHSEPVSSNLIKTANGYMTVSTLYAFQEKYNVEIDIDMPELEPKDVLVQYYSNSFELQSEKVIPTELEYFGGFYESAEYYYLVFGQDNLQEDNKREVLRLVRYNKQWERLTSASLYGANVYKIFDAGSLGIAEDDENIYVHTSREMFESSDGLHHQSNITMIVNKNDMSEVKYGGPYTSHSFNQFIIKDDAGTIVTLDHGDGYPQRGLILSKKINNDDEHTSETIVNLVDGYSYEQIPVKFVKGEAGFNYTGVEAGGLDYSSCNYLTVYSSIVQDESWMKNTTRNVYVSATPIENFSMDTTIETKITNYEEGSSIIAGAPILVKIGQDSFVLMWEEVVYDGTWRDRRGTGMICYVLLNGEGKAESSIKKIHGYLSDASPIYTDHKVIWYTAETGKITFYSLDIRNGECNTYYCTSVVHSVENKENGIEIKWTKDAKAIKYQVLRQEGYSGSLIECYDFSKTAFDKWESIAEVTSTEYLDTSVKSSTYYSYSVRAVYETPDSKPYTPICYDIEGKLCYRERGCSHTYKKILQKASMKKKGSITEKCNKCGVVKKTTTIPAPTKISLSAYTHTYSGKERKPSVTIYDTKGRKLSKKRSYRVSYKHNKYVGKAMIIITFKGNYSGKVVKRFPIIPKPPAIQSLQGKEKSFTISWKKVNDQVSGYQIQYSANKKFPKKQTKMITIESTSVFSKTISTVKATKYYVRVRSFKRAGSGTYYSKWSKVKMVKAK